MTQLDDEINLGAFVLKERLAGGGMGTVYRARHVTDGTEVAVKVPFVGSHDADQQSREFRREVQALARLNHPHIATIHDFGTVPDALSADQRDAYRELTPGAPWLAMEYIEGETAARGAARDGWAPFRKRLLALLDALAHAHAYGVLHRDLKPTNVIIDRESGEVRVVDFGIAAVFESEGNLLESDREEQVRGTPKYMAPEQVMGESGNQGPWTDLYAVGCLAWRLVCGEAPFEGDTEEVLRGQLNEPPTGFQPTIPVPREFRWWLGQMLNKSPHERPQSAALAAYHLNELELDESEASASSEEASETISSPSSPTLRFEEESEAEATTDLIDADSVGRTSVPPEDEAERAQDARPLEFDPWGAPPIPKDWRRGGDRRVRPLSASGLELFGLRRVPVADRDMHRDILWTTLRRVARNQQPNAVLMTGPVGTGKSKLAEWLVRRARELSAAFGLDVVNQGAGREMGGIARQILDALGVAGLEQKKVIDIGARRLEQMGAAPKTSKYYLRGIAEAAGIGDASAFGGASPGFEDIEERHSAFRHVFRIMSNRRPVVLWLDDIPRSPSHAQFVRSLFELSEESSPAVQVVMTGTDEAWESNSEPRTLLEPVISNARGVRISVGPLSEADQREVIARMLRFEQPVVESLVANTHGRPLHAVQIVSDWVERGLVQTGEEGYELDIPLEDAIPASLDVLWLRRVDEIVQRYGRDDRRLAARAIEAAATLGLRVEEAVWREVCDKISVEPPDDLVDELIEAGLAERLEGGWRFAHRLLPSAVYERASEEGRAAEYNRACGEVLESNRQGPTGTLKVERAVDHWEEAGDIERALEAASDLYDTLRARRWTHWAEEVLERIERFVDELGITDAELRYWEYVLRRSQLLLETGRLDEAEQEARKVFEQARSAEWTPLVGRAAMTLHTISYRRSRAEPALEALEAAEDAFVEMRDPEGLGRVLVNRATVLNRLKQDFERGGKYLRRGRDLSKLVDNPRGVMRCEYELSIRALQEKRLDEAERRARKVVQISEEMHDKSVHCSALNALGEIARYRGNLENARDYYLQTLRENRARGSKENEAISMLNLGTTELELGNFDQARQRFHSLLERMGETGFNGPLLAANIGLLVSAASDRDDDRWDELFEEVQSALDRDDFRYEDHARVAEKAARLAEKAGWFERARDTWLIVRDIWEQLQNEAELERVEKRLADISVETE